MCVEREIEFKTLLTEADYKRLIDRFAISDQDFFTQVNVYYDTENLDLTQQKCALRIRMKDGKYILTLKEQGNRSNLETNQTLHSDEATSLHTNGLLPPGPVRTRLRELNIQEPLYAVTQIVTKRAEIPYRGQRLFFDQSTYEGVTDYELELEATNYETGQEVFESLLTDLGISYRPSHPKIYRALTQKKKRYDDDD
ncbi:MAG TPA: CYTH domain-containing protein [Haloplasmataceae bacterium]